jgi:hypothetical protein
MPGYRVTAYVTTVATLTFPAASVAVTRYVTVIGFHVVPATAATFTV